MGHASRNMDGSGAEDKVDYDSPAQEASGEKTIDKCYRKKKKNLPDAKSKSFGSMTLAKEISSSPALTLLFLCRSLMSKGNHKRYSSRRQGSQEVQQS